MIIKHRDRELLRFDWLEPQGVYVRSVNEAIEDFTQKRVAEILEFGVKADRCVSISKKVCTINPANCESLALQMKDTGVIRRCGSAKKGHWEVIK